MFKKSDYLLYLTVGIIVVFYIHQNTLNGNLPFVGIPTLYNSTTISLRFNEFL